MPLELLCLVSQRVYRQGRGRQVEVCGAAGKEQVMGARSGTLGSRGEGLAAGVSGHIECEPNCRGVFP